MFYEENANYPHRGEVYYIDSYVSIGRAISPKQGRPAVIMSRNERNRGCGTVQIVYLTHSDGANSRNPRLENSLYGKIKDSIVVCDQIHTIDKKLIGDFIARVDDTDMRFIESRILNGLCIDPERHCSTDELKSYIANTDYENKLKEDDGIYKRMYYELIDHLRGE